MLLIACSVFDVKAKAYMQPFFVHNENLARRSFGDAVLDKSSGISRHPEDYLLYKVGVFDDGEGIFQSFPQPEFLAKAVDFVGVKTEA